MRFLIKTQKKRTFWFLVPLFLLLSSSFSIAQFVIYRGQVVDECTGEPIEGAEIRLLGNSIGQTPGAYTEFTDANGDWIAPVFGFDTWTITVSDPIGVSDPGIYFFQTSSGSQAGVNFSVLPGDWEPILNGNAIPMSNNPSFPVPLCLNEDNCLDIDEAFREKYGDRGTPTYCFRGRLYRTNRAGKIGELLAESPCIQIGGRGIVINDPCDPGVNLTEVFEQIEVPTDVPLLVEIIQFCCNESCLPGEGALVNRQEFFIEVKESLNFDFEYGASPAIDAFNDDVDGNTDLTDNLIPRVDEIPGPLLGPSSVSFILSPGLDVDRITSYQVIIEEVSCITGATQAILFDQTFDDDQFPLGGVNPNFYEVGPPGNEEFGYFFSNSGYFGQPSQTEDKCYKVRVIADSDCGPVERVGFFQIAQLDDNITGCPFCLTDENGNVIAGVGLNNITAFPSPTDGLLTVQIDLENETPTQIHVQTLSGQIIMQLEDSEAAIGINQYQLDLSNYPIGIYLLSIRTNKGTITQKIVKQ